MVLKPHCMIEGGKCAYPIIQYMQLIHCSSCMYTIVVARLHRWCCVHLCVYTWPCLSTPDTCSCPRRWSDFRGALSVPVTVPFCRAPEYVRSPCECQDGCQVGTSVCLYIRIRHKSVWMTFRLCWRDDMILTSWGFMTRQWQHDTNNMTAWCWQHDSMMLTTWQHDADNTITCCWELCTLTTWQQAW